MAEIQKKCICFSRVSSEGQNLEPQNEKIIKCALEDGYSESDIILISHKESAVKLSIDERLGLVELKNIINDNKDVNAIYIYELSRLSRRPADLYKLRDYLHDNNVNLICLNPSMRLLNNDGTYNESASIIFGVFVSLSEQEGFLRKARIKKAVDKNKALGLHTGGNIMFGYTTNKNHEYVIDYNQGRIVEEIFDLYVNERWSIRKIAKDLYERGVKMRTVDGDSKVTSYLTMTCNVNNILHREEYYGAVKGKPAIISKAIFDKAQEIMKDRIICDNRKETRALLKGMIYDKNSGLLLSVNSCTKYYYSKRMKGCSISFKAADKIVLDWLKDMGENIANIDIEGIRRKLIDDYTKIINKQEENNKHINEIKDSIDRLETRIILGKISKEKAEELENKLESELDQYKRLAVSLFNDKKKLESQMSNIDNDKFVMDDNMSLDDKIKIVKHMIKKIYISRENRTIALLEIHDKYDNVYNIKVDTYHCEKI